jgi:hypothetical protein
VACVIVPLIWTIINTFAETLRVKLTSCYDEVFRQMPFFYFSHFSYKNTLIIPFLMTSDHEDDSRRNLRTSV